MAALSAALLVSWTVGEKADLLASWTVDVTAVWMVDEKAEMLEMIVAVSKVEL